MYCTRKIKDDLIYIGGDDRRLAMRTAAMLFAKQHQGATVRTVTALGRWLDTGLTAVQD